MEFKSSALHDKKIEDRINEWRARYSDSERLTLIRFTEDDEVRRLHHDLNSLLRSFKYLRKSVLAGLSQSPTDQRKAEVLNENLEFIEYLRQDIIEKILPLS